MRSTDELELIASIAEDLPVGVWVAKVPGGELLYANRTFQEILGIAARDDVALGEYAEPYGICGLDGQPYPEARMPFVQAVEARTTVVVDDIVIHRRDGGRVNIRASARPVFVGDEISHVVIAFIDISREVEAERARREGEARLRHAQRLDSIGSLAGGIAHDFNNLLASVKILATHLARVEVDPEKRALLATIDQVTDAGAQLTRALLRFARREAEPTQRVSLAEVVRAMIEIASRTFEHRVEIACELDPGDDHVVGAPSQLGQVVMNLVLNARDAMPDGGRVTVRTRAEPGLRVLEVEDVGRGIPDELRDRVFEPYFTTKEVGPQKGTGLGLSAVYGIVQAHGGEVSIARTGPDGTLMRVVLPAAPEEPGQEATVAAPPPRAREAQPASGTVLVVDDEAHVRDAASRALRGLGYDVLHAEDGRAALEVFRARRGEIAVVLLDLVMPGMDGLETLRALREIDRDVAVVIASGLPVVSDPRDEELGAPVLEKPFDVARLAAALAQVTDPRAARA